AMQFFASRPETLNLLAFNLQNLLQPIHLFRFL
ncbi:MAG: hypothetical protein QOJ87_2143, partial [Verrucomicrobiota bacterium]